MVDPYDGQIWSIVERSWRDLADGAVGAVICKKKMVKVFISQVICTLVDRVLLPSTVKYRWLRRWLVRVDLINFKRPWALTSITKLTFFSSPYYNFDIWERHNEDWLVFRMVYSYDIMSVIVLIHYEGSAYGLELHYYSPSFNPLHYSLSFITTKWAVSFKMHIWQGTER